MAVLEETYLSDKTGWIGRPLDPRLDPTKVPGPKRCAWAAGFLEGRGNISLNNGTPRLVIQGPYEPNNPKNPLTAMRDYFGGTNDPLYLHKDCGGNVIKGRYLLTNSRLLELFYKIERYISPTLKAKFDKVFTRPGGFRLRLIDGHPIWVEDDYAEPQAPLQKDQYKRQTKELD